MRSRWLRIFGLLAATLFMFGQTPAQAWEGDRIWAHRIKTSTVNGANTTDQYMFYSYPGCMLGLEHDQIYNTGTEVPSDTNFRFHSVGRWAWLPYNFFSADIKYNEQSTTLGKLEGLNVLESGGDRVMADFVWPVLHNSTNVGRFVLRCVIFHDHPTWLFAQATVYNPSNFLRLNRVSLYSYVGGPKYVGYRTRITGATGSTVRVNTLPSQTLSKDTYWATAFSRIKSDPYHDTHGNAGIFLKDELAANGLLWGGNENGDLLVYPLSTHATYKKNLKMAISDFHEQNVDDWLVNGFQANATHIRGDLSAIAWDQPDRAAEIARLVEEAKPITDTRNYGNSALASTWDVKLGELGAAALNADGQPIGSDNEQNWGRLLTATRDWLAANADTVYLNYTGYIQNPDH